MSEQISKKTALLHSKPSLLDKSVFRKKLMLKLFANPLTLFLMVGGITDLLALWTFGINSGMCIFAGGAGILGSIGISLTRLFLGEDKLGKEVIEDMEVEADKALTKRLDELDSRLSEDGDPRTESSLRDLRQLAGAFHKSESWPEAMAAKVSLELLSGIDQMFDQCVLSLEKTLELWYTASQMTTLEARQPILNKRDRIVQDIGVSIKKLGKVLAGIQTLDPALSSDNSELARIRRELDQNLQIAARVKKRMQVLDREIDSSS